MSATTSKSDGLYKEHDFVLIEATNGQQLRVAFGDLTLADLRVKITSHFFPHMLKDTSPAATPQQLRLVWCGKEIQPGIMWHCGRIPLEDQIKLSDMNPGCKSGEPKILVHATGGTDFSGGTEGEDEDFEGNVNYTHSAY